MCIIGGICLLWYGSIKVDESIIHYSTMKVAKVRTWRHPLTGFLYTKVITYDGSRVVFWGDLSDTFQAEGVYDVSYRAEYRLLGFARANKLLSYSSVNGGA